MKLVKSPPDILIADDDPTAIVTLQSALIDAGHEVAVATSGRDAISQAKTLCPRLLILDVGMPDMDGFHVCRYLRSTPAMSDIPILFLSGSATLDARIKGLNAGAVDFLAKPFDPAELLARVQAQLDHVAKRERLIDSNRELNQINAYLQADLLAASRIQKAMLPQDEIIDRRVRFAWRCVQCNHLGGDAVNIMRLTRDSYGFYVLDASGHGAPASLLAVATGYFVAALYGDAGDNVLTSGPASPAVVLNSVNRVLSKVVPNSVFVTMLCGVVDLAQRSLVFSTAGHPGPLLLRRGAESMFLDHPAPPAGIGEWNYTDHNVQLMPQDRFVLYSDGLYEQRNAAGDRLDRSRIADWISACAGQPAPDAVQHVMKAFEDWRGPRAVDDDMLLMMMDYMGDA